VTKKFVLDVGVLIRSSFRRFINSTNYINDCLHIEYTEDKGWTSSMFYLTITGEEYAVEQLIDYLREKVDS
jgi:hypothetical protein